MSRAVLSIGSNLGDRLAHLRSVVAALHPVAISPVYETAPWGGVEQDDYLNAILVVADDRTDAYGWLQRAHELEQAAGRTREVRWGPRTLDVDVIDVDGSDNADPELTLPHPRAHRRAFVLVPWAEVAPEAVLRGPGGGPVGQLAVTAPDRAGIRWLALDWLTGPTGARSCSCRGRTPTRTRCCPARAGSPSWSPGWPPPTGPACAGRTWSCGDRPNPDP